MTPEALWGVRASVTSDLCSVPDGVVGLLELLLGLGPHAGVLGPAVQRCSLVQQPLQQQRLAVHVARYHPLLVHLPHLLLQSQLELRPHVQSGPLLGQPAFKLLVGLEVLAPVEPHPLDPTAWKVKHRKDQSRRTLGDSVELHCTSLGHKENQIY